MSLSNIFNRFHLRKQLLAAFCLAFVIAGLAAAEIIRRIDANDFQSQISKENERLSLLLASLSSDAVRNRDEAGIHRSLEMLIRSYNKILNATFFDPHGEIIGRYANAPIATPLATPIEITPPNDTSQNKFDQNHGIVTTDSRLEVDGEYLGRLSLTWDTSEEKNRVQEVQRKTYLTLFGLLAILGLVLMLLLNKLVLHPIVSIQQHMKRVQSDAHTPPLQLDAAPELQLLAERANEFGSLMDLRMAREAQLADAARAKSEFLANMSHELRTPMNGVLGMLTLLEKTNLDLQQKDQLAVASSSGKNLLKLINDILDYSKIEAGRMEFESIDFNLHEIVETCCATQAEAAHIKSLELVSIIDSDVPSYVRGDPTRIRQVLNNLISNAIKFTERGTVVVRLHLLEASNERCNIQFNVTDNGIGLEQSAIDKVFESFAQADGSTTRKYGGTGLGLAICRQLAEGMGGTIGVESQQGVGSNFWMEVPLEHSLADTGISTPGYRLQGTSTLIIDPGEESTEATKALLSQYGAPYATANTSEKAMELLHRAADQGQEFDLILVNSVTGDGTSSTFIEKLIDGFPQYERKVVELLYVTDMRDKVSAPNQLRVFKPLARDSFYERLTQHLFSDEQLDDIALKGEKALKTGTVTEPATETVPEFNAGSFHILIAEDNPVNQMVAEGILESMGYNVHCVDNGSEAVDFIDSSECDLILMDCQMPIMDGYEATRQIRKRDDQLANTPIIALTANAMEGDAEKCLAAGMNDYVSKPFEAEVLEARIREQILAAVENRNSGTRKAA